MAVDIFLLIFVVALIGGAVGANIKLLFHYQSDDTAGFSQSVPVKVIIVASLTLAWIMNILIPVDVRNTRPDPGDVDMGLVWTITFVVLALCLAIIVPAAMFYHEVEDEEEVKWKSLYVLRRLLLTSFVGTCIALITWIFLGDADIPVQRYACDAWADAGDSLQEAGVCNEATEEYLTIKVSIWIYIIAFLSFLGSFFFATFGGIGLAAVPIDLIIEFIDRPRDVKEKQFLERKKMLGEVASKLLEVSEELVERDTDLASKSGWRAWRQKRQLRKDYSQFTRDAHVVEDAFDKMQIAKFQKGESLLVSGCKLLCGVLFAFVSFLWILHIVLYVILGQAMARPPTRFLNDLVGVWETLGLYPLSVAIFASFNLYLLLCVVKGCMKVGMRACFIMSLYPMRYKATPLNSFLFNILLVLISSAAVVQFSQEAFADYARLTDAEMIFAAQTKHMKFLKFFFENSIFMYILLGWFVISLIYLLIRPRDTDAKQVEKALEKQFAKMATSLESATEVGKTPLNSKSSKRSASAATGGDKSNS